MLLENSQVNLQHGRCKLTKRRCCVEPAASMPLLPARLSSCGLLSSVRPCTLLNDKFFYRKTYCCLEPPPSVVVCSETKPAKCVVRVQCGFENKLKRHRVAATERIRSMLGIQQDKTLGLTKRVHQKALETAKVMLTMGYPLADICKISKNERAYISL